ncbi:glycosyltransferase family 2 protein [Terribacillus saccharophilus]|uniref:glycosyltransferase family 2 protein n=1 Tax=Terribacillus saccharophilus TaxID=361277 RepID=UPI003D2C59EB
MNKKLSVIIPVYNVELYLRRCIDSVINQTYRELEIILVNDGSTDDCGEICEHYKSLDDRIIVIHKENGGLSDARNAGLEVATGDYISFVDSDDLINEDMYSDLIRLIIEHNCDIAESDLIEFYKEENLDLKNEEEKLILFKKEQALISTVIDQNCKTFVWNKVYKKHLWNDIRFPKGRIFEDTATTYKVVAIANGIIKSNRKYYYYFQRSDSIANSNFNIKKLDHIDSLLEMFDFIEARNKEYSNLVSIKIYTEILIHFQHLLRTRKNIEGSNILIQNIRKTLLNERLYSLLRNNPKNEFEKLFNGSSFSYFDKQRRLSLIRIYLLKHSALLLYLFNTTIAPLKKSIRSLLRIQKYSN